MKIRRPRGFKKSILTVLVIAILTVGGLIFAYANNFWRNDDMADDPDFTKPEVTAPRTQSEAEVKEAGNNNQGDGSPITGGVKETDDNVTPSSNGIHSENGSITLYSPTKNQNVSGGVKLSGASSLESVAYRLKDTEHGVIGQGSLSVRGGYFSGILRANTTATTGSIEVFSIDNTGREIEHIKVPITF